MGKKKGKGKGGYLIPIRASVASESYTCCEGIIMVAGGAPPTADAAPAQPSVSSCRFC